MALAVVVGVFGVATPAHAAYADCPSDYVCIWAGSNFTTILGSPVYRSPGTCHNLSVNLNDKAGSFYNHLSNGHHVTFYSDAGCTGFRIHREDNGSGGPHGPGVHDAFIYYERDDTSSIYFNTG